MPGLAYSNENDHFLKFCISRELDKWLLIGQSTPNFLNGHLSFHQIVINMSLIYHRTYKFSYLNESRAMILKHGQSRLTLLF